MNLIFVSGKILPRPPPSVSPPSGTPFDCLRSIINAAHREHVKVDSLRLIQQGKRDCSGLFSLSLTHTLFLSFSLLVTFSLLEDETRKMDEDESDNNIIMYFAQFLS